MLVSCTKREPEERPVFPTAEYFTPSYAAAGDTIKVSGLALDGSTVSLNGTTVSSWVENDNQIVKFIVPVDYQGGKVSIKLKDNVTLNFIDSLRLVDKANPLRGVPMLLMSDFDGAGIRPAYFGSDFNSGQWGLESPVGATYGVGANQFNIPESPAGGYYMYNDVLMGSIGGPGTDGWGGALVSRNELLNDGETSFPISLGGYPNTNVIFDDINADYYLNFYYYSDSLGVKNRKGLSPASIRVYMINPLLPKSLWYAFSFSNGENMNYKGSSHAPIMSDNKWHAVSVNLKSFTTNYSFDTKKPDLLAMQSFNAFEFGFNDSRVDAQGSDAATKEEKNKGIGPMRTAIDHISLTKNHYLYEKIK